MEVNKLNEFYTIMPLFLWMLTFVIISLTDFSVKKRLGIKRLEENNLQLPRFIAIMLDSAASIGIILFIRYNTVSADMSTFFVVPYFGIVAYYITIAFRELKDARIHNKN